MRLIRENERLVYRHGEVVIYYKRVPSHIREDRYTKSLERGQLNGAKYAYQLILYAIVDWAGIEDEDGQPLAYSPSLVRYLPEEINSGLIDAINTSSPEVDTKNSLPSLNGSLPVVSTA